MVFQKGRMREYRLGEMLRRKYDDFLGPEYKASEVYAYSSDIDRTKESLQLVLASLFKPNDKLRWNPDLNWIPVAYNTQPLKDDLILKADQHPK